jgi:hypothetical protein
MREIRPYGSEGGARFNSSLLPLSAQLGFILEAGLLNREEFTPFLHSPYVPQNPSRTD